MTAELVRILKILYCAYFSEERCWRVRYNDGGITRLLPYGEAIGLVQIYGGIMFIDYKDARV